MQKIKYFFCGGSASPFGSDVEALAGRWKLRTVGGGPPGGDRWDNGGRGDQPDFLNEPWGGMEEGSSLWWPRRRVPCWLTPALDPLQFPYDGG